MIVGTKHLVDGLRENLNDLESYAISLVPPALRHVQSIVDNQKYLIALEVRNMLSIPFKRRQMLYEQLLQGVRVTGSATEMYDLEDLLDVVDLQKLKEMLGDVPFT